MGRGTGRLLAANTVASLAGSTLAVFAGVPLLGAHGATVAAAAVALAAVVACSWPGRRAGARPALALLVLLAAATTFLPSSTVARERWLSGVYDNPDAWLLHGEVDEESWDPGVDLPFHAWGREATISVARWYLSPSLLVNGKTEAGDQMATDVRHLSLLGHLPVAVHPDPRRVLVVGLGMGITWKAVEARAPGTATVVEIEPAVVDAAASLGVRPARVVLADARTWLAATDERYDVITSDPIHPWVRGSGDLYTREYFEACRARLAPRGVACQWLPLYQMGVRDVVDVVRTFAEVYRAAAYFTGADLVLLGVAEGEVPAPREPAGLALAALEDLGAADLAALLVAGDAVLRRAAAGGTVLADDALRLEFSTPRRVANDEMVACLDWVAALWPDPPAASSALLAAQRALIAGDGTAFSDALDRGFAAAPDDPFLSRFAGEVWLRSAVERAWSGDPGSAERFLAGATRRLEGDPRLLGVASELREAAGDREGAARLLEALLRRDPGNVWLLRRISRLRPAP